MSNRYIEIYWDRKKNSAGREKSHGCDLIHAKSELQKEIVQQLSTWRADIYRNGHSAAIDLYIDWTTYCHADSNALYV